MTTFRDIKRAGRRTLHQRLSEPVIYVTKTAPLEFEELTARLHLVFEQVGDLARGGFSDREEVQPSAIFLREDVSPVRGDIVVTKDMGAWRVDHDKPPNDITIEVELLKLTDKQVSELGWAADQEFMGLLLE